MSLLRQTISVCQHCFKQIPAEIHATRAEANAKEHVVMMKGCSEHGQQLAEVESSLKFWQLCQAFPRRPIFDHMVLDVTARCNLRCRHCYYPLEHNDASDPSIPSLLQAVLVTPGYHPVLSGGDPTVRDDLPSLVDSLCALGCKVSMITNALKLADPELLKIIGQAGLYDPISKTFRAAISLHPQGYSTPAQYEAKEKALANIAGLGWQIPDLLFTISDLQEAEDLLPVLYKYRDLAHTFRIRSAFNNWNEHKATRKIFASELFDLYSGLAARNKVECAIPQEADNNHYHFTIRYDGMLLRLISAPDKTNVDLLELQTGPMHRANNGEMVNLFHSFIINEGMQHGWLNGKRIWPVLQTKPPRTKDTDETRPKHNEAQAR